MPNRRRDRRQHQRCCAARIDTRHEEPFGFEDTDTALIEFTGREVAEIREISESIYVDLDSGRDIVSMTIERAKQNATLDEVAYQQMAAVSA